MQKKINVGLIGGGFVGRAHSNAYRTVPCFFKPAAVPVMKAICDNNEVRVKEVARAFGWESCETSWEKLIRRADIDLIDICAPSNVHKEIALAAIEAGKEVFCEKPLALDLKDARQMLEAAEKAGIKHMVGFSYRGTPAVRLAKKLIDEGKIGRIFHFRAFFLQDWLINPNFPLVWRLRKEIAGSGAHSDLGAHLVDYARFLIGEFDEVIGMSETFVKERPKPVSMVGLSGVAGKERGEVTVDDATLFLARFKSGALGTFEASRYGTGKRSKNGFEIDGSKGSIAFNFEHMNYLQFYSTEDPDYASGFRTISVTEDSQPYMKAWWPAGHGIGYEHTFIHEIYELLNFLGKDEMPVPNFTDGVRSQEILEAVEESVKKRQWVKVDRR